VIGAHTLGFNTNTFAVSSIGNHEDAAPTALTTESIAQLMPWKLGIYRRDPAAMTRALDGTSRPVVGGHRDASATACPGEYLYAKIPAIRKRARDLVWQYQIGGYVAIPLPGDVDGDGLTDLGRFQGGKWAFQLRSGEVRRFGFGRVGDLLVLADFDGDGRDEPGIFRAGDWHLRSDASAGAAWLMFRYGTRGDIPLAGRWPGSSGVGLAVVRGNAWLLGNGVGGGVVQRVFYFGRAGDAPLVGDWLGNGTARPAVVRGAHWYLATSVW
jgi:hypothetical protein